MALFLRQFLGERFKENKKIVDIMVCSIIYSCFLLKEKFIDCEIFYKFVIGSYKPIELSYFIFVRAVIEKETLTKFFDFKTGKCKEVRNFYLQSEVIDPVLAKIFGIGKEIKINRFKQKVIKFDRDMMKQKRIHVYRFLKVALEDYYRCRKRTGEDTMEEEDEELMLLVSDRKGGKGRRRSKKVILWSYGGIRVSVLIRNSGGRSSS